MWLLLLMQLVISHCLPLSDRCLIPNLENGRAREKGKYARIVRFKCRREYILVGSKYAHCVRGAWDTELPICIKPGCRWTRYEHMNGLFLESYRGALVKVECHPGYATPGPSIVFCDGFRWNGTFPVCKPRDEEPAKSCDFESEDLCGWSQIQILTAIQWKRTSQDRTKADHTYLDQPHRNGHYMAFDSLLASSRTPPAHYANFTSRLYSPVYPKSLSSSTTCFSLWYHMSGQPTDTLKIYLMMEGQNLESIIPDLWLQGSQGTSWQKAVFTIQQPKRDYQIVIEGIGGGGSDILFDDVNIGLDEECEVETTTELMSTSTDAFDIIDDFTCRGRCSDSAVLIGTQITAEELEEAPKCDCHPGCVNNNTCCPDYTLFCPMSVPGTEVASSINDEESVFSSSDLPSSTLPITSQSQTSLTPLSTYPITNTVLVSKPPTTISISTKSKEKTTVTSPRNKINSRQTKPPKSQNNNTLVIGYRSTKKTVTLTTKSEWKTITAKKPFITTTDKSNEIPLIPITSHAGNGPPPKTPVQLISFTKPQKLPEGAKVGVTLGSTVHEADPSDETIEPHLKIPLSVVVEVSAGAAVLILLAVCITVFFVRRRRLRIDHDNMAEDSDVRFLTSDEILDFTLAKPADSEL